MKNIALCVWEGFWSWFVAVLDPVLERLSSLYDEPYESEAYPNGGEESRG